jgi:hypothetical protein
MNTLPIDRMLATFGTIANRPELKRTRERLSRHLWKVFIEGEYLTWFDMLVVRNSSAGREKSTSKVIAIYSSP